MRTYYQVYRNGYFHTYTLDKAEAFELSDKLAASGNQSDVRVEGRVISRPPVERPTVPTEVMVDQATA